MWEIHCSEKRKQIPLCVKVEKTLKKILLPWSLLAASSYLGPCLMAVLLGPFKEQSTTQKQHLFDRFPFVLEPGTSFWPTEHVYWIVCMNSRGSTDASVCLIGCCFWNNHEGSSPRVDAMHGHVHWWGALIMGTVTAKGWEGSRRDSGGHGQVMVMALTQ